MFPTMIWNAMALKSWGKPTNYVQMILDELSKSGASPELAIHGEPMVRMWVQRKEQLFPEIRWGIEDVVVYRNFNGELVVRVIARTTEEFKDQFPDPKFADEYRSTLN